METKRRSQILFAILLSCIVILCATKGAFARDIVDAEDLKMTGFYNVDAELVAEDKENGIEADLEHYYKIIVPEDGCVTIKLMSFSTSKIYPEIWKYDMSAAVRKDCNDGVEGATPTSPKTGTVTQVLSSGTYYLKIFSKGAGRYKLCSSYSKYGVNDYSALSFESARIYTLGSKIVGAITPTDTEDFFKVKVKKSGKFTFYFANYCTGNERNSSKTLSVEILNYDASKTLLSQSVGGYDNNQPGTYKNTELELPKGTYIIKVTGATGKYTTYLKQHVVKKKLKCKVTAKKNKKKVTIKTTPGAKVRLKYGGKIYKRTAKSSGKVTIKVKKKLRKGAKLVVNIKKKGYSTIKRSIRVK